MAISSDHFGRITEEAERHRLERAVTEQLAYLGHEFRTPLTAIVSMAEVLKRRPLSADEKRCVDTILSSCDALEIVVDNFLDFSRIQTGRLDLRNEDFDLHEVVESAIAMFTELASDKGVELATLIEPDVPTTLKGDAARLRQVLINLISNALKFTAKGHVTLRVTLDSDEPPAAMLRFLVNDTGVGIPDKARAVLFEPFASVELRPGHSNTGLGLGLYIAKCLASRMGGEIGVEADAANTGSTFWFTARQETRAADAVAGSSPPPELRGVRVLVLDKSPTSRDIVVAQASACGMRAQAEADAAGGLKELRSAAYAGDPYDLVLIDTALDRFEIFSLLQSVYEDPELPAPEMVAVGRTADTIDPLLESMLKPNTKLTKPIRQSSLAKTVLDMLAQGAPARETGRSDVADSPKAGRRRVLLVEDSPVTREANARLLQELGLAVDVAAEGRAAVEAASASRYDAIFMDRLMPGMDGLEAAAEIRRREGGGPRTPIIGMTACPKQAVQESLDRDEIDDYLSKPAMAEEIVDKLDKWCPDEKPRRKDDADWASILATDPVLFERLRSLFVEDSHARLEVMRRAAAEGDSQTLAREAHTLAGGCLSVGATALGEGLRSLEALARADPAARLADALSGVEQELRRVTEEFAAEKAAAGGPAPASLTEVKE